MFGLEVLTLTVILKIRYEGKVTYIISYYHNEQKNIFTLYYKREKLLRCAR